MNVFENQHLQFFHKFGTRWESWSNIKTLFPNQIWKNGYSFQGFRTKETGKNPRNFYHHCHTSVPQVNVLLLGLAFMLIFTGYITMAGIQVSLPWLYRCLSSGNDIMFTSLTILPLQTIIILDNSQSSDNYICICINSWERWLCAWIQGSCMFSGVQIVSSWWSK